MAYSELTELQNELKCYLIASVERNDDGSRLPGIVETVHFFHER